MANYMNHDWFLTDLYTERSVCKRCSIIKDVFDGPDGWPPTRHYYSPEGVRIRNDWPNCVERDE